MWNERAIANYFGSNSHTNKPLTLDIKPGGGESAVDSVMIHTCILWSEAARCFLGLLSLVTYASMAEFCVRAALSVNINRKFAEECDGESQLPHVLEI
jgi:hypothetical protein